MTKRVHASVYPQQLSALDPSPDELTRQAMLNELPMRDDSVLTFRNAANEPGRVYPIAWPELMAERSRMRINFAANIPARLMRVAGNGGVISRHPTSVQEGIARLARETSNPARRSVAGDDQRARTTCSGRPGCLRAGGLAGDEHQALELGDEYAVLVQHPCMDLDDAAVGL